MKIVSMTIKNSKSIDRRFRIPRLWSNQEIKKIAHLFTGSVINVSGWKDLDKEGKTYRDYFINSTSYTISNHPSFEKGYQQGENEVLIDLEKPLESSLIGRFSVVFNHTVLEHVFDFKKAIENICLMSNDVIVTVVPFMQQMHGYHDEGGYGDYWRFTPLALSRLYEEHGYSTVYQSYNDQDNTSVYVINVCTKHPHKWKEKMPTSKGNKEGGKRFDGYDEFVGCKMILSDNT